MRVRGPFRNLFASISIGNIIGVLSIQKRTRLMKQRQVILTGLILLLLSFQVLVLVVLALFPYAPDLGFSSLNNNIYAILAPLSTVFLLGLLYTWLIKLGTREARHYSRRFEKLVQFLIEPFRTLISSVKTRSLSESARSFKILSHPRLLLAISLAVSLLLAIVPYRSDLNPTGSLIGIDSPLYVTWINQMLSRPFPQALQYSFVEGLDGSRPLLLVILYTIASLGVSPTRIIEYLPMILAPLLSLSTYTFVRFGQGSQAMAGLTALFTPFSFYLTVGLWGGYYANMLALIFVFLFLTLLLQFSRSLSAPKYVLMLALSVALFLTHPWTWVLIVTVGLVFAISLYKETRKLVHMGSIIAIIGAGMVLDLVKSLIFATRAVGIDVAGTFQLAGTAQLASFWSNLVDSLLYTHEGLEANWIILGLGLLAAFSLRVKDRFERLLALWVGVSSIPFLVLDSYHQARIVYDLPIPVLMSVAVLYFFPHIGARTRQPGIVIALVLVTVASYALQGILLL